MQKLKEQVKVNTNVNIISFYSQADEVWEQELYIHIDLYKHVGEKYTRIHLCEAHLGGEYTVDTLSLYFLVLVNLTFTIIHSFLLYQQK